MVHVRDLDALDGAQRDRGRERRARVVRVDVHLERRVVADDEQRVAHLLERRLERRLIELVALDDEHRAVAVLRELLVDRVEAQRLARDLRRRAAARRLRSNAMPRTISTSPAPPASTTPASRRTSSISGVRDERVLPSPQGRGEQLVRRELAVLALLRLLGHLADDGEHRPLHGPLHGSVGGVARAPERLRELLRARAARSGRERRRSRGRSGRRSRPSCRARP